MEYDNWNSLINGIVIAGYCFDLLCKPPYQKTNNLHMQKQRSRSAYQRLCFRYMGSTGALHSKSEFPSLSPSSVLVQLGLYWTCSETTLLVFSLCSSFLCKIILCVHNN